MRIVFMGTPDFAVPSLKALVKAGYEICGVFTQPDKPRGRKQILCAPPVKELAVEMGIPVYQPATLRNGSSDDLIRSMEPDFIVVVAYGKLLPRSVLDIPKKACVNVHGSLLPRYRGAAPIQWSVINGDETAGVTTMLMAEGMDTGDMLLRYETPVGRKETGGELFDRLSQAGAALLIETLEQFDRIVPQAQDETKATKAPMLSKEMAELHFAEKSVRQADCMIRGLNPWPVAWSFIGDRRIKIFEAEPVEMTGPAGTFRNVEGDLIAFCQDGALRLVWIQPENGKRMPGREYLKGHVI